MQRSAWRQGTPRQAGRHGSVERGSPAALGPARPLSCCLRPWQGGPALPGVAAGTHRGSRGRRAVPAPGVSGRAAAGKWGAVRCPGQLRGAGRRAAGGRRVGAPSAGAGAAGTGTLGQALRQCGRRLHHSKHRHGKRSVGRVPACLPACLPPAWCKRFQPRIPSLVHLQVVLGELAASAPHLPAGRRHGSRPPSSDPEPATAWPRQPTAGEGVNRRSQDAAPCGGLGPAPRHASSSRRATGTPTLISPSTWIPWMPRHAASPRRATGTKP